MKVKEGKYVGIALRDKICGESAVSDKQLLLTFKLAVIEGKELISIVQ